MKIGDINKLSYIVIGIIMVFLGATTVFKIYKGSKVTFAYIMTAFTCAYV